MTSRGILEGESLLFLNEYEKSRFFKKIYIFFKIHLFIFCAAYHQVLFDFYFQEQFSEFS